MTHGPLVEQVSDREPHSLSHWKTTRQLRATEEAVCSILRGRFNSESRTEAHEILPHVALYHQRWHSRSQRVILIASRCTWAGYLWSCQGKMPEVRLRSTRT